VVADRRCWIFKKEFNTRAGCVFGSSWDVVAEPSGVEYLFTISYNKEDVQVFQAHVDSQKVTPQIPYAVDVAWCSENEIKELGELAFEHSDILDKFFFR